jgi:peroxiredoxin
VSGPLDFPDDEPDRRDAPRGAPAPARRRDPPRRSVPRPPGAGRYRWFTGIVVVLALGWISLNTLRTDGIDSTGLKTGERLPPFAAPLALSDLKGDVNFAVRPDSGDAGARPACEVRGPDVLNVCELAERGPVVLVFLATRGGDCTAELDRLETVRRDFPGVQVAAVSIKGDRGALGRLIREHGWRFPVGYDADGVLANVYGVAVCPQVIYAYPGGVVRGTVIGEESEAAIRGRFERLVAASRERGWRPAAG